MLWLVLVSAGTAGPNLAGFGLPFLGLRGSLYRTRFPGQDSCLYRIWVEGWLLRFERKTTAMGKEAIGRVVTSSATSHTYWRMRHDTVWDDMVFETAPKVSGAPGTWTPRPVLAIKDRPPGGVSGPGAE